MTADSVPAGGSSPLVDRARRIIGGSGIDGRTTGERIILHDLGYTVLWLAFVAFVAIVAVFVVAAALTPLAALALVGLCGLVSLAAGAAGGMLGFLFGIPRTLAGDDAGSQAAAEGSGTRTTRANTNLEQVSDWLSKIIIGASLVEVKSIGSGVTEAADGLEARVTSIPGLSSLHGTSGILILLMIVFSAAGFLTLYLQTRTFLAMIFARTEDFMGSPRLGSAELGQLKDAAKQISLNGRAAEVPAETKDLATRALGMTPASATDADALKQRGLAQVVLGQTAAGADALKQASRMSSDPELIRLSSRLLARTNRPGEAKDLLGEAPAADPAKPLDEAKADLELTRMFVALYEPPPEGFTEALRLFQRLRDEPVVAQSPRRLARLQLYAAAAYGQKYRYCQANGETVTLPELRNSALEAARAALAADPTLRPTLLNMLEGRGEDDDLVVFKDDPDFRALTGG